MYPGRSHNVGAPPMTEIVLVRHAESEANLAAAWQGRGDAGLSATGRDQVKALAERVSGGSFDAVLSSPLSRALDTAAAFDDEPEAHDDLIEVDLGGWEGMSIEEVATRHRTLLRSIYGGSDEPFGEAGERMSEVAARTWAVIDSLGERLGPEQRAVVVTHGGVIDAIIASFLPTVSRRPHRMASNASLTHLVGQPGSWRLSRFNDTAHLDRLPAPVPTYLAAGDPVVALIRHGRTRANVDGRFQGQTCWGLDEVGHQQAGWLQQWYGPLDRVYSSPLDRARATAAVLCAAPPVVVEELMEISLGAWEGLTWGDVRAEWGDLVRRIYEDGEDLPRGEHGETWQQVTDRIAGAIGSLELTGGAVTGVVTHGGVIRAYVGTLGGAATSSGSRLATPENTSVTHIALTGDGPVLCDYGVAPHLEQSTVTP